MKDWTQSTTTTKCSTCSIGFLVIPLEQYSTALSGLVGHSVQRHLFIASSVSGTGFFCCFLRLKNMILSKRSTELNNFEYWFQSLSVIQHWNNVEPAKSLEDNHYTEGEIMGDHRCENCGKTFYTRDVQHIGQLLLSGM